MGANETPDIRDIKGLIDVFSPWGVWLFVVVLLVAALLVAYYFYNRKKKTPVAITEIVRPPHEIALEELEALKGWVLSIENMKKFHFALSDIIRKYLESQYGLPATDRTSEEIALVIKSLTKLSFIQKESYLNLLKQTDRVKFTDLNPGEAHARDLVLNAETFVRETRPEVPIPGATP